MPKLNDILKKAPGMSVKGPGSKIIFQNKSGYVPKPGDEKKFIGIHKLERYNDRNGNGDDVFKATNVKTFNRSANRYGYDNGEDENKVFVGDKSKTQPHVNNEEMSEELYEQMVAEGETICETSLENAKKMAQELADKFYSAHFVHEYVPHWDKPDKKSYGVISKRHYDNDDSRHYGFHLTHIVHPNPLEQGASPGKFNKSSRKIKKVMKESSPMLASLRTRLEGVDVISKGDLIHDKKHGNPGGFKAASNDNKKNSGAKILPFKRKVTSEQENPKAVKGPTPGQTKAKRLAWLRRSEKCGTAKFNEDETIMEKAHRRFLRRRKGTLDMGNDKQPNSMGSRGQTANESIDVGKEAGATIHDFVHSKNNRFEGKSKKERIRMALGAFYAHHRGTGAK